MLQKKGRHRGGVLVCSECCELVPCREAAQAADNLDAPPQIAGLMMGMRRAPGGACVRGAASRERCRARSFVFDVGSLGCQESDGRSPRSSALSRVKVLGGNPFGENLGAGIISTCVCLCV